MTQHQTKNNNAQIIICDTNVVILMYLFKPAIMFDSKYSFGKISIHACVVNQIQTWIDKKNKKSKKFGLQILEGVVEKASTLSIKIKEPGQDQLKRSSRVISAIENRIPDESKGMATDDVDKYLLTLAHINCAHIVTQEKTMLAVARKTLTVERIHRFEDLVLDLINFELLKKEDIKIGLDTLDKYKEYLDLTLRNEIKKKVGLTD